MDKCCKLFTTSLNTLNEKDMMRPVRALGKEPMVLQADDGLDGRFTTCLDTVKGYLPHNIHSKCPKCIVDTMLY